MIRKKDKIIMKKNVQIFMAGFITCLMIFASATTAFAAANGTSVTAMLNGTVKMMLNGSEYTAKDQNGNVLLPITYDNRTYLPVRSLSEALNVPIEYVSSTNTIWIGERNETVQISNADQYKDYYGTVLTKDPGLLKGGDKTYGWGVTNNKTQELATLGCGLSPMAQYKTFAASAYVDDGVKADLVIEIRKDTFDGPVLKSYTLSPGETIEMEADITGVSKFFVTTEVRSGHDKVSKLIIGEPVFKN